MAGDVQKQGTAVLEPQFMSSIIVGLMWVVCGAGVGGAGRAGASASSSGDGAQATGAASVRPQEDGRRLGPAPAQPHTWAP